MTREATKWITALVIVPAIVVWLIGYLVTTLQGATL